MLGNYFLKQLKNVKNPVIKEVRGKGLLIGVELTGAARPYCEALKEEGLLCKETHDNCNSFCTTIGYNKRRIRLGYRKDSQGIRVGEGK